MFVHHVIAVPVVSMYPDHVLPCCCWVLRQVAPLYLLKLALHCWPNASYPCGRGLSQSQLPRSNKVGFTSLFSSFATCPPSVHSISPTPPSAPNPHPALT